MTGIRNSEEARIMAIQHWEDAERQIDEMMDGVGIDFVRLYLENLSPDMTAVFGPPTEEEAREFLEKLKASVGFDLMMIKFMKEVIEWPPSDCYQLVMNSNHLQWVRNVHQRYQRLRIYTGAKKKPGQARAIPKMYGVPIMIDETVTEPRLE